MSGERDYGVLDEVNIDKIQFGLEHAFTPLYGSSAYFSEAGIESKCYILGTDYWNNHAQYESVIDASKKQRKKEQTSLVKKSWLTTLYVCDYCFKYTNDQHAFQEHMEFCEYQEKLPGKTKYLSPKYTIRRIKCYKHRVFAQCLSLFTKLLLDNKSTFFNLDHYEFYLLYETGKNKPMGFFSKDLYSFEKNNLGTILVFPPYQRRGLGTLLIEFSYKLSNFENCMSGPEKPLSPFGTALYVKYWSRVICKEILKLATTHSTIQVQTIVELTKFRSEDIALALKFMESLYEHSNSNGSFSFGVSVDAISEWATKNNVCNFQPLVKDEYLLLEY
ncbi:hypothetical protein ACO0RG_001395 [Hanseniaspora osmophila]